jgi:hypothetical protein
MRTSLAVLCLLLVGCDARPEAVVSVGSYHWERKGQNEFNPGCGIGGTLPLGGDWSATAVGLGYCDSRDNLAWSGGAGARWMPWVIGGEVTVGAAQTSTYTGPTVVPTLLIDCGPCLISASALGDRAVGFTLRIKMDDR